MSNFYEFAIHPISGERLPAQFMDDFYPLGESRTFGVHFPDGRTFPLFALGRKKDELELAKVIVDEVTGQQCTVTKVNTPRGDWIAIQIPEVCSCEKQEITEIMLWDAGIAEKGSSTSYRVSWE